MLFSQLSTNGSSSGPELVLILGSNIYPAMFEITRCDSRTAIDTCKEAGLPAEHGRPLLEVRRCGDGHPPVTERERVIRLNGIGGVRFQKTRIEISIRVFVKDFLSF